MIRTTRFDFTHVSSEVLTRDIYPEKLYFTFFFLSDNLTQLFSMMIDS